MSKQSKSNRPTLQNNRTRWLVVGGVVLVSMVGVWFALSGPQISNGNTQAISQLHTRDFHSLVFSPTEPDTIFFGHHDGLLVSRNGGKDWQPTTLQNADAMALAAPLTNPHVMYAAGHNVFLKTTDDGQSWQSVATNLPGLDIHGFTANPENADELYAHVVGFGIFGTQDGGTTWTQLSTTAPPSTYNLAMGEHSQTLYAAAGKAGLWRSPDGGHTWAKVSGFPDEGAIAMAFVPADKRLLVAGNVAGLYASNDGGKTWASTGVNGRILAIAASPHDANRILAISNKGQVFASRDNGRTWTNK
ncbi:MAG: YCF48-related protein [Nitrospirota bacterium]